MNGQPTAQNTRECGANGDLPGFRNWANDEHVAELAEIWNVEPSQIPHYGPPTHAMQILRYAEEGSLSFLWISGTNPAVSLPELSRIRDDARAGASCSWFAGHFPDRDDDARRCGPARGDVG